MSCRALKIACLALVVPVLLSGVFSGTALGQEPEEESIFRRFALRRDKPKRDQTFFEFSGLLRPQTDPEAEIERNIGLNYVVSFRPNSRVYFSRSVGFTTAKWQPSDPGIEQVKVTTIDLTFLLSHLYRSVWVTSFGLGLGLMDGLIVFNDARNFDTRLEAFIPAHLGIALRLGETMQVGLKLTQSSFFRSKPVVSFTRLMVGIGYNY